MNMFGAMKKMFRCFSFLLLTAGPCFSQNADINLLRQINPVDPGASFFWKTTTNSAYPVTVCVQGGLMAYDYFHSDSTRGRILPHIAEKLVVVVMTEGIKLAINRTRPYIKYPGLVHPYDGSETGRSLPSAHTSLAFNTAATLDLRFHKWYISVPAYLWAGAVGYSRLYMGEHYPTDVLAGAVVGIGSAYLVRWLDRAVFKPRSKELRHISLP